MTGVKKEENGKARKEAGVDNEVLEETPSMSFYKRFVRAPFFDKNAFRTLEYDKWGFLHGFIAILIVGGVRGIGNAFAYYYLYIEEMKAAMSLPTLIVTGITTFMFTLPLEWLLLTGILYFYGIVLMKGTKSLGDLVKGLAFVFIPLMLEIFFPLIVWSELVYWVLFVVTQLWMIAILTTAVNEILKLSRWRGVIVVVLTYITFFLLVILFIKPNGP